VADGYHRLAAARAEGVPVPVRLINEDVFGEPDAAPAAMPSLQPEAPAPQAATASPLQPGAIGEMDPADIKADPVRFQYKRDTGGAAGVGDELKGIKKYDPELGGVLSVWRDPEDGQTYVVNGHHRLDLAMRAGAPSVAVRYLGAETASQARLKGAMINIAEGRGTAIDAAKIFRDNGMSPADLGSLGISV
jgi:hypothetical protein